MFYVVEVSLMKGKDKEEVGMYSQETRDEAVGLFHQKMGGAMRNENFLKEKIMVVDDNFAIVDVETWSRAVQPEIPVVEQTEPEGE